MISSLRTPPLFSAATPETSFTPNRSTAQRLATLLLLAALAALVACGGGGGSTPPPNNPAAQTITFANPGAQIVGTPLTLSATASSGLTVSFASTTTSICTVSGGTATFVAAGTCTIQASQAGNSSFKAATPVSQSFTVNASAGTTAQTITFNNPGAQAVGTPLTLSATASSGLSVSFASTTTSVCTVSGTTATFLTAGTCTIRATQAGNSTYSAATPVSQSFTVNGSTADVTITIDPNTTQVISPYIYGVNDGTSGIPSVVTFNRQGGNRWTAYNWENNYSNAGSDYYYQNDTYLSSSTVPAEPVRLFIAANQSAGRASLVTFQLQGYVSADASGPVDINDSNRFTARFKQVVYQKGAPFTATPPATDAFVYMDEFAWALDQKFPTQHMFASNATVPTFISLDNEPDLWCVIDPNNPNNRGTHPEVQSSPISSTDFITKTSNLAKALKDQYPDVTIFGPVNYGWGGIYTWQGEMAAGNYWFADKYLQGMKAAETAAGKRLLDVYDFHWYSEAQDAANERVVDLKSSTLNDDQIQAIVQSPRSLWDTTYKEKSWITQWNLTDGIYLLKRLKDKINAEYPGTKLAVTEYENGGFNHIAGTVAQADNLGIFGAQGIFAANFWPPGGTYPYTMGAFRSFRGFNGSNANFGDTSIKATSSDVSKIAVYVSSDTTTQGRYVIVAINRSSSAQTVQLNGLLLVGTATKYQITATSAASQVSASQPVAPVNVGSESVNSTSYMITLPALSVTTIEVK